MALADRITRAAETARRVARTIRPLPATWPALAGDIDGHGAVRRTALRARLGVLIDALSGRDDTSRPGGTGPAGRIALADPADHDELTTESLLRRAAELLAPLDDAKAWLTLAVLEARLPQEEAVRALVRTTALDGLAAGLRQAFWSSPLPRLLDAGPFLPVRVVTGAVLVDVHHTSQTDFATGIQRVTREVSRRWAATHPVLMVGWTPGLLALRPLTPPEARRAFWGGPPVPSPVEEIVVPWRCTYLLPELAAEVDRAGRLRALASCSGTSLNMIGYDMVPVSTAETSHEGLVPGFALNLSAARHTRVIVPISEGAANEYRGWRTMLAGTGLAGPVIAPVVLATQPPPADAAKTSAARRRLVLGALPMVLVVGSHEPRKNHLAVLHAAERLWRQGHEFTLTFIGGNSWYSETFTEGVERLQLRGRPVEAISAADDDLLWGAYRCARFTVFPSVNEGFGLPVAESLCSGTPVITSNFGSMKEIADAGGGALLVDPRDDDSITDAMRALLSDDDLLARLATQARARPVRTWDEYAADTWTALTTIGRPAPASAPTPAVRA